MEETKTYRFHTHSVEETWRLAEVVGRLVKPGDVLTMSGDLGAGKTTFTQGLARGIGVHGVVNSPTFTIIKEYAGRMPLYHMDVYRMEESGEDLGFDEYFYGDGVTVVEWPQMIEEQLPPERCDIIIKRGGNDSRVFLFTPLGSRYKLLCEEVENENPGN